MQNICTWDSHEDQKEDRSMPGASRTAVVCLVPAPVSVDPDDLLTVTTTHLRSSSPVINLVNPGVLYMVYNAFADIIERTEAGAVNPDDKDNLVATRSGEQGSPSTSRNPIVARCLEHADR